MATVSLKSYKSFLDQVLRMEEADRKSYSDVTREHFASARVAANNYRAGSAWLTCAALLAFLGHYDLFGIAGLIIAWVLLPLLGFTDRVQFDGRYLTRHGLRIKLARRKEAGRLALADIAAVETIAVRSARRGGRVYYRYRCIVTGGGQEFVFVSGGAAFRRLVRGLFAAVPETKLDARSLELRDHLVEPQMLARTLKRLALASENLLDNTAPEKYRPSRRAVHVPVSEEDWARGQLLRRAANELYVVGRFREAAEAFRRALRILPHDPWLLYEFARFLHSQAGSVSDSKLWARGQAALQLAAQRGAQDACLLIRIGESFLEYTAGSSRAERFLRRALAQQPDSFRAVAALAEIGLRRGQIAQVQHHYGSAAQVAPDNALAYWALGEGAYYQKLNQDDEFLAAELRRIEWLQSVKQMHYWAVRIVVGGTLLAWLGPLVQADLGTAGWSLAVAAWPFWGLSLIGGRFLIRRRA